MENLYSVRIIRRENQVVQGVYIKEFWMFCGIYVNEFVIEYDNVEDDHDIVDFNIVLDENAMYLNKLKARHTISIIERRKTRLDLSGQEKRQRYGKKIGNYFLEIPQILGWNTEWTKDFTKLYKIFVDSDFAYNNYLTHMYLNQFSDHMNLIQIEILNNCLSGIYVGNEDMEGLILCKFAYFNCARKINRISASMKLRRVFDDEKIMEIAHQMSVDDEKFTMGDVLAGLIGLSKEELYTLGESYMHKALNKEGYNKYSAFIYYSLAHYYEVDQQNNEKAWELYCNMKNIASQNYRMLFKHATQLFHKKNYIDSWKKFFDIYNMMRYRINNLWAQPLELEYCYKCAKILNRIPREVSVMIGVSPIKEEDIQKIEKEDYRKSKFMNNFIFNNNLKEIYVWYFKNKMESHKRSDILREI